VKFPGLLTTYPRIRHNHGKQRENSGTDETYLNQGVLQNGSSYGVTFRLSLGSSPVPGVSWVSGKRRKLAIWPRICHRDVTSGYKSRGPLSTSIPGGASLNSSCKSSRRVNIASWPSGECGHICLGLSQYNSTPL
jgi:hypothetical protein